MLKYVAAFDCFGTVFDTSEISDFEISDYVKHVRQENFSPYIFPDGWFKLKAHSDSAEGIKQIKKKGIICAAFSNGSYELIYHISQANNIRWDYIIDLSKFKVYKPNLEAYRAVAITTKSLNSQCFMITANPTFGDVEGALNVGMRPVVIRHGYPNNIIELSSYLDYVIAEENTL